MRNLLLISVTVLGLSACQTGAPLKVHSAPVMDLSGFARELVLLNPSPHEDGIRHHLAQKGFETRTYDAGTAAGTKERFGLRVATGRSLDFCMGIPGVLYDDIDWQVVDLTTGGVVFHATAGGWSDNNCGQVSENVVAWEILATALSRGWGGPATAPVEPSGAAHFDVAGEIEKLFALKERGVITEEEFRARKKLLLER